jgi:hypothetical protein
MDSTAHPLKQKKPVEEMLIFIKDIRSDITQIKRELLYIKNFIERLNESKVKAESSGWFF